MLVMMNGNDGDDDGMVMDWCRDETIVSKKERME